MLYEDEDDFFIGSPRSKFFDIIFNANKDLVKHKLLDLIDRYNAMEILLEKNLQSDNDAIESLIKTTIYEEADEILRRNNNLFIATMGDILTQHE
ncbi:MAG: DUF2018 family protein [Campylobacteraceae bacterium]|nr:DUF2018 family protein [Campylobacteraceae bacterium]